MKRVIVLLLIFIIFVSCTRRSTEIISAEHTPSIQFIEDNIETINIIEDDNIENENTQYQQLPILGMSLSNNRNQQEFNAYEFSHRIRNSVRRSGLLFAATLGDFGVRVLELYTFVAFSREDLHLLRSEFEDDLLNNTWLQQALSAGRISEESLNATYGHNINLLKSIENNFPVDNDINKALTGVWRLAYTMPNQGYTRGDYLILYENGMFEYISRNFMATRHGNQIFGGSKFGLWTTNTDNDQESDIELLIIYEFSAVTDDPFVRFEDYRTVISAFGNSWIKFSNDVNIELGWGSRW